MLLCILDGCGIAPKNEYNAYENAKKETLFKDERRTKPQDEWT